MISALLLGQLLLRQCCFCSIQRVTEPTFHIHPQQHCTTLHSLAQLPTICNLFKIFNRKIYNLFFSKYFLYSSLRWICIGKICIISNIKTYKTICMNTGIYIFLLATLPKLELYIHKATHLSLNVVTLTALSV